MDGVDTEAFDGLMSSLDPPLVVVTTAVGDERGGCLVGFHAQAGIDPDRYCLWLSKANHTYRLALRATHLGVHFLAEDQLDLAERFGTLTGDDVDKFEGLSVTAAGSGCRCSTTCRTGLAPPHRPARRRLRPRLHHRLADRGRDRGAIPATAALRSEPSRPRA